MEIDQLWVEYSFRFGENVVAICPRVALLVESSRAYGRGLLHGIAEYVRLHGPWSIYLAERGLETRRQPGSRAGMGTESSPASRTGGLPAPSSDLGVPTVDLRGLLTDLRVPLITTDDDVRGAPGGRAFPGARVPPLRLLRLSRRRLFRQWVGVLYAAGRGTRLCLSRLPCVKHSPWPGPRPREQRGWITEAEVARWIEELPKPVGVMACNDIRAQQVLTTCRAIGVGVPDEVAVLGVDNDEVLCDLSDPPLSSVVPDTHQIGFRGGLAAGTDDERRARPGGRNDDPPARGGDATVNGCPGHR